MKRPLSTIRNAVLMMRMGSREIPNDKREHLASDDRPFVDIVCESMERLNEEAGGTVMSVVGEREDGRVAVKVHPG